MLEWYGNPVGSNMLEFFKKKPLLDEVSTQWLFDAYGWALRQFGAEVFFRETVLVTPTNRHFPGQENSAEGMASLIFDRVKAYARVEHWPHCLVDGTTYVPEGIPRLVAGEHLRGSAALVPTEPGASLIIPYNPHQIAKPESLIASYAYVVAYYLGQLANEPPPGGEAYWPYATELLGVFMGFGLMFANTAYTFRGGCGSCYNPLAERTAFLSQDEVTYALALFSALKGIDNKEVLPHLKKYLQPVYKRASNEIRGRASQLSALRAVVSASSQTHGGR